VSEASFSITPTVMTFPDSGSPTTAKKITVTNLVSTTTYTVCFETAPTTGCSSGTSATGSTLGGAGTSVIIPDLTPGLYYVNIESAISPPSANQIVATSTSTITTPITLT